MTRCLALFVFSLGSVLLFAGAPSSSSARGTLIDGIGRDVTGELIFYSDIKKVAKALGLGGGSADLIYPATRKSSKEEQAKELLTNQVIMAKACKEIGRGVGETEVSQQINRIIQSNQGLKSEGDLAAALKREGRTLLEFKEDIERQLVLRSFLGLFVNPRVTKADLKNRYFADTNKSAESVKVKVQKLRFSCQGSSPGKCVEAFAKAEKASKALSSGKSFEEVLRTFPKAGSARYEDFELTSLGSKKLQEQLESTLEGESTEPVEVAGSIYLFWVISKAKSFAVDFDEARLRDQITQERRAIMLKEKLKELRSKYLKSSPAVKLD